MDTPYKNIKSFALKYTYTAISCLFLLTFGIFLSTQRRLLDKLHKIIFTFYNPPTPTKLPLKVLDEIIDSQGIISVVEPTYTQGNVTTFELIVLNAFVKLCEPRTMFEIGTFDGRTTLNLCINSNFDTKLYTIDLPKDETRNTRLDVSNSDQKLIETNVTGSRFINATEQVLQGRSITQLYGDTASFDFSPYFNSVDLVFVDAAHTYEYVKNDSEVALKLLRNKRGIILWHDYDHKHQGSIRAIEELQSTHPDWNMFHVKDTNIAVLLKDKD